MYSFTEIADYLFTSKGVKFLLSERFNQDPLEIYFSKQRSLGAMGDNPSVQQCLQNAQAIRAAKTLTLGNCNSVFHALQAVKKFISFAGLLRAILLEELPDNKPCRVPNSICL